MPANRSTSRRRSHWLLRLLGIAGWILAIGTFLLCIPTPLGPARLGFTIVSGHSMEPTYWTNDIVVTWRTGDYSVGEPIVYTIPADEPGAGFNVVHRITAIRANGTFQTWGDNNAQPDMWQPGPGDVKGHVFFHIPKIGLVFHPGVLPLALAGIAGIFVSMSVWNWLDDGTDEDGDDGPAEGGPQREPRRHRGVRTALSMRRRVARALRGALRIPPPKHARPRPAWRRRVTLGLAAVLLGTAGAAHATSLGGIRAANMFAMSAGVTVTTPPPASGGGLGLAALVQGTGDGSQQLTSLDVTGSVFLNMSSAPQLNCNASAISGDLVLYEKPGSATSPATTLSGCPIGGSLDAYGDVVLQNAVPVGGNVVSTHGSLTIGTPVGGSASAYGAITVTDGGAVGGSIKANLKSAVPAVMPASIWYDYAPTAATWSAAGYQVRTLGTTSGTPLVKGSTSCDLGQPMSDNPLVDAVNALTTKTVIDATACSALNLGGAFTLKTDVTFLTGRFTSSTNTMSVRSSSTTNHQFNVIEPESAAGTSGTPDCTDSATRSMTGWGMADNHVSGLVYTPCKLQLGNSGTAWRGQIFAGTLIGQGGSASVTYVAMNGLPGAASTGGFGS